MLSFKPTEEQYRIFKYIAKRKENLLIEARAGCGKTSTIVEATKLLPEHSEITFLAFNKHIKKELEERLPENVRCYTTHGIGLSAIKRKYPNIEFDEFKVDHILKKKAANWKLKDEFGNNSFDIENYMKAIKKMADLCRLTLTMEKKWIEALANKYDIKHDRPKDIKRIMSVMEVLFNDRKTYDYTDMVFIPAVDKKIWFFPQDYVILDECQDMSRAQQMIIMKMLKRDRVNKKKVLGRLISVGDPFQSIYSFAGSDFNSFEWFRKLRNTKILPLTYTFRCGKEIVKKANEIVSDIHAMENAHEGQVRKGDVLAEPEDGDFVLCRTTEPLVKLFEIYLREGRKATIKGKSIGLSLIEMTKNQKTLSQLMGYWATELNDFEVKLRKKGILNYNDHGGYVDLKDRINSLRFLAESVENIADLRKKIGTIFTDEVEGIVLSTVHKAKGLEANRVFIARPDKLPLGVSKGWQYQQEKNLEYVAITRAKHELVYDFEWKDEEDE